MLGPQRLGTVLGHPLSLGLCLVALAASGLQTFALLPGFLVSEVQGPFLISWVRGGDPGKDQMRWEPQEPPVWSLCPNSDGGQGDCAFARGPLLAGPPAFLKNAGKGAGTDRKQDMADQRQDEVRGTWAQAPALLLPNHGTLEERAHPSVSSSECLHKAWAKIIPELPLSQGCHGDPVRLGPGTCIS